MHDSVRSGRVTNLIATAAAARKRLSASESHCEGGPLHEEAQAGVYASNGDVDTNGVDLYEDLRQAAALAGVVFVCARTVVRHDRRTARRRQALTSAHLATLGLEAAVRERLP